MNSSTSTIEDLPPEMIGELFEYLSLKDLAACSLINKRWHSIYSNFKLHSLVATDWDDAFRWYNTNQTVEEKCICSLAMFSRLVEKPLLSNLKHLAISMYGPEIELNQLNRFQQLVHLEITVTCLNQTEVHLNLPNLKVLVFHYRSLYCVLSIDSPLLSTLVYSGIDKDMNRFKVKHPEIIRKLETHMVAEKLAPFESVECLVTGEFEAINKATLLALPRLRELRYTLDIWYFFKLEERIGTADRVKRTLSEFLNEAKKLRGSDFRFTFVGLQLTNVNVDQIDFGVQVKEGKETVSNECFYMKNYHLIELGALDFVGHIDYIRLLNHVTGEFPRFFSQKFTGIVEVAATAKVPDPDHFVWFLKSLRSPRDLFLEKTGLSQEFFNKLPALASSLTRLTLNGGHCENELNLDFIGRLSRLSSLKIETVFSLESLPLLIRWLGRLKEGKFRIRWREEDFSIEKNRFSSEWEVKKAGEFLFESEKPEEIANFFQG